MDKTYLEINQSSVVGPFGDNETSEVFDVDSQKYTDCAYFIYNSIIEESESDSVAVTVDDIVKVLHENGCYMYYDPETKSSWSFKMITNH